MSDAGVINQENLRESKIALVYGQMNEPPGARLRVALSGLAITEYFRDEKNQDVCSLSTTSSVSLRLGPRYRLCSAVPLARSVISRRFPPRWALCKNALLPPRKARSRRFRLCTFLQTT